jgi:Mg-chelatase subunit ChlD
MPLRILCLLSLVLSAACGGPGLRFSLIDSSVQRPSNVALYFTVDTADGEPVPGLEADAFRIYEDDRLVSIHESKQTILNPEVAAEHFTLLLVDMSGSVVESGDVFRIVDAATAFAEKVSRYQKVALFAFDGRRDIARLTDFTSNSGQAKAGIRRLDSFRTQDPSTNLNGAIIAALGHLDRAARRSSRPLKFGTLVVFTDGSDRAARVSQEDLYQTIDESEHDILVIGVGTEVDEEELAIIGRSGVILSKDREEISSLFEEAAARIEAYSRRYYLLGYCSPARSGVHTVRIEADFDGKSGSLAKEFSAKGFRAPCNPEKNPRFNVRRPSR